MNIFGIGLPEMAVIMIVALLIFGPKKLPEMGKAIAKTIRSFQQASKEFEQEFKREASQLEASVKEQPSLESKVEVSHTSEDEPQDSTTVSNNSTPTS
ncbi:TatA/E family twin arginine-targeting protein translocase [Roseofilum capinflatum]|uniref:Sec-independent protein translocase protein TatA n=1 Tax=Roseofilum capinflatum BLCC-M114 TaxID=3022440 RepID=A0ABT7B863_9CYAN|nr:TatA/E family twin arginine-targeting protein translocase [Roseofilum capinflatum]MDJ1175366.1 TatA/E family twin arginine-targeting protein translocase [Roseofilum capinflatum BLCC-M114]